MAETYLKIINESEAKFQDKKEQIEQARNIWSKGFVAEEIENYQFSEKHLSNFQPE